MMAAIRSRYGSPSDLTTDTEVSVVQPRMQPQPDVNMHSGWWLLISSEAGHGRFTFKLDLPRSRELSTRRVSRGIHETSPSPSTTTKTTTTTTTTTSSSQDPLADICVLPFLAEIVSQRNRFESLDMQICSHWDRVQRSPLSTLSLCNPRVSLRTISVSAEDTVANNPGRFTARTLDRPFCFQERLFERVHSISSNRGDVKSLPGWRRRASLVGVAHVATAIFIVIRVEEEKSKQRRERRRQRRRLRRRRGGGRTVVEEEEEVEEEVSRVAVADYYGTPT
ncbi:hypothetical protein ANTRET_LOCUS8790, partial [Anthophora retusa]